MDEKTSVMQMEYCRELENWKPGVFYTLRSPAAPPLESDCFQSSTHAAREICIVLKGESRYFYNGSVYPARPGDVFLIERWMPHGRDYTVNDHDLIHLWLSLSKEHFRGFLIRIREHGQITRLNTPHVLAPEYAKIVTDRWNLGNRDGALPAEELLAVPLAAVIDEIRLQQLLGNEEDEGDSPIRKVIETVKFHIASTNARNCSMKQLEKLSGYNGSYLSHKFHEIAKCTIGAWIDQVRINYTAAAEKRGMTQKEIAFELGFSSPANFWRWLRNHRDAVRKAVSGRNE